MVEGRELEEEEGAESGPGSLPQAKLQLYKMMSRCLTVTQQVSIVPKRELNCWPISF